MLAFSLSLRLAFHYLIIVLIQALPDEALFKPVFNHLASLTCQFLPVSRRGQHHFHRLIEPLTRSSVSTVSPPAYNEINVWS